MTNQELAPQDGNEITIVEDEYGLAVFGNPQAVELWLNDNGIKEESTAIDVNKLARVGGQSAQAGAKFMEESGRWVKLTKESAVIAKKYAATTGAARTSNGQIVKILDFAKVGGLATPAGAAVLGGMLAQYALEQSLKEISQYLKKANEKLDALIQDQKDRTFAELFSFRHAVEEAALIRQSTGLVSDTTWMKIANIGQKTARIQKYALQKLDTHAGDIESSKKASTLSKATKGASEEIQTWLAVLGQALYIQDQLAVLELERVLVETPELVESHRTAIMQARENRLSELESHLEKMNNVLEPSWKKAKAQQVLSNSHAQNTFANLKNIDGELDRFSSILGIGANTWDAEGNRSWFKATGDMVADKADTVHAAGRVIANRLPQVEISIRRRGDQNK